MFWSTLFWNKADDVIVSVRNVTNKILLCDLNYISDLFMWTKFANYSISMREVATTFFYKDSTGKTTFLRGGFDSSPIIWDLH